MWTLALPSSCAWLVSVPCVNRKTIVLMAISDSVTIGQRRAVMFSCRMGISIPCDLRFLQDPDQLKEISRRLLDDRRCRNGSNVREELRASLRNEINWEQRPVP